jgi:hypothetical protein
MKNKQLSIAAFSVLEITLVLALLGILSALFFGAINRFQATMHNDISIKSELNSFFQFRSNLWRELDQADSIKITNKELNLFLQNKIVIYSQDGSTSQLKWSCNEAERIFDLEVNAINIVNEKQLVFDLIWKEQSLKLHYPIKQNKTDKINQYFNSESWK